jgi:hypothetical protein
LSALRYDVFGNKIHAEFGNGVVSDWTFDPLMVRLATTDTVLPNGSPVQKLAYQYDAGSKLPGGGTWNFSYDGVDRLTQAQGNQTFAPNKVTSYTQTYTFDSIHNTKTKKRVHGITNNGGSTQKPSQTNIDFAYVFGGTRPHAPTSVGDSTLNYDPAEI